MNISLKGIRRLGVKKILDDNKLIVEKIHQTHYTGGSKPFSFLSRYSPTFTYKGMDMLIDYLDITEVTNSNKREFRNFWNNLFKLLEGYIPNDEVQLLREFGLRCDLVSGNTDILKFYNELLTWGVFAHQEKNIKSAEYTTEDVLYLLIHYSSSQVYRKVWDILNG